MPDIQITVSPAVMGLGVPWSTRMSAGSALAAERRVRGTDGLTLTTGPCRVGNFGEQHGTSRSASIGKQDWHAVVVSDLTCRSTTGQYDGSVGSTFEQAAAVPTSGSLAVQGVRDEGRVRAGQKVLINGAGGAVGTFAVQLAKAYGADVTGVDAAGKLDMLRSIGADRVLDYTRQDFTRSGERYDVILDRA